MSESNDKVFVFGSNLAGRHGKGAALWARKYYGAVYGQGVGFHGNSYAIPTKDENLTPLPLDVIENHVKVFVNFTKLPDPEQQGSWARRFFVTAVGCGLAGYKPNHIAPFFVGVGSNVELPESFEQVLHRGWDKSITKSMMDQLLKDDTLLKNRLFNEMEEKSFHKIPYDEGKRRYTKKNFKPFNGHVEWD